MKELILIVYYDILFAMFCSSINPSRNCLIISTFVLTLIAIIGVIFLSINFKDMLHNHSACYGVSISTGIVGIVILLLTRYLKNSSQTQRVQIENFPPSTVFLKSPAVIAREYLGKRVALYQAWCNLKRNEPESEACKNIEKALIIQKFILFQNPTPAKGFLWKVEYQGQIVHLVGTQHADCTAFFTERDKTYFKSHLETTEPLVKDKIHSKIQLALMKSDILYVEVNLFDPDICDQLEKVGMRRREETSAPGLDIHLMTLATETSKKISSIETVIDHINLSEISDDNLKILSENVDALCSYDAYHWGEWESYVKCQPFIQDNSLQQRNQNMFLKIFHSLNNRENALFAVGCGHLTNEIGIISLLEKAGAKVTRVELPDSFDHQRARNT